LSVSSDVSRRSFTSGPIWELLLSSNWRAAKTVLFRLATVPFERFYHYRRSEFDQIARQLARRIWPNGYACDDEPPDNCWTYAFTHRRFL
jgi:hypothetical protein